MYKLYHFDVKGIPDPEAVITEDSNSGYEYFNTLYQGRCISAHGKSNVYDSIRRVQDKIVLTIVDGAAFGSEIGKIIPYLKSSRINCTLYAPESFEYLILNAGLMDVPKSVLQETYLYADSKKYLSWEEFFSSYLADITRNTVYQYSKTKLAEIYKTEGTVARIAAVMPEAIVQKKDLI